jgi:hypothetical protein
MSEQSNKGIDLRFADEVLDKHNLDALADFVAEDFIEENVILVAARHQSCQAAPSPRSGIPVGG